MSYGYRWNPYVSVAKRRQQAAEKAATLKKSGRELSPVEIDGRKIAETFWGESWCQNLEAYSDYANRLPRGRTYVRNGSVIDLQIEAGRIRALVSGSSIYQVDIAIQPLAKQRWAVIKAQCAGKIDSLVELLRGSISKGVMEVVTRRGEGLFPTPKEIALSCSCPDWAMMCKHVAAVLYGVGARLDHQPEMLFTLRGVEPAQMIAAAVTDAATTRQSGRRRTLKRDDLSSVFGIDLDPEAEPGSDPAPRKTPPGRKTPARKTNTKTKTKKGAQPVSKRKPLPGKAKAVATKKAGKKPAPTPSRTKRGNS